MHDRTGSGADTVTVRSGAVELHCKVFGDGPLVLALHGFPDTFATFDTLAPRLAAHGYRVVCPALRGYAPSSIPADGDYGPRALASDAVAVMDRFGAAKAAIVGHDWGAVAAAATAAFAPARTAAVALLATGPLAVMPTGLRERLARPHNILLAQGAWSAWWLRRADFAAVRRLYRKWSPSWTVPTEQLDRAVAALRPPERTKAALAYYAARLSADDRTALSRPIAAPALMLWGEDEPGVRQQAFRRVATVTGPGSVIQSVPRVGHWPHLEAPEQTEKHVVSFLMRHFPPGR